MTIIKISDKLRLASKQSPDHRTVVEVGPHKVGGDRVVVIAGPCSVESRDQLMETARAVKAGARRGGPRDSGGGAEKDGAPGGY